MAIGEENPETPAIVQERKLKLGNEAQIVSQTGSSQPAVNNQADEPSPSAKKPLSPKEAILSVAQRIASQPLPCSDPDVWGVLTGISDNARKRLQGINMLLIGAEHCIGRLVEDMRFQIESNAVSQHHCEIFRKQVANEDTEHPSGFHTYVILKDTSTNGTYVNWEKLKRGSSKFETKLHHGDIVSFAAPPQHEHAFAFVYRQVPRSDPLVDGVSLKRKAAGEFGPENKRLKGIGIGAPEGPISLDDFRSLQRSNTELRKQLENQVLTIDTLRNENRAAIERHENVIKDLKESISKSYLDQLKESGEFLESKQKELVELNKLSAEQKQAMEDLSERLATSMQSCAEANEIMKNQKASITELKVQLEEEREQRREEREKASADMKAAIQKVQSEAQDELKRLSDAALRREREQQEVITKLQESERESSSLLESLRSKLEETRQKLVISDNKVRQLETQVSEEQQTSALLQRRVEELELETKRMRKELESEKSAREEAWAKMSALELEINAAMRELDFERRRLKAARERIMLRETQLRAFYSTTEEISVLFAKQQEQLKAMQRTLEDEENYENASLDVDLSLPPARCDGNVAREMEAPGYRTTSTTRAGSATSAQRGARDQVDTSSDEASVTEKHDCDIRSQDDNQNTQEADFPNEDCLLKGGGFGSAIDGVDTANFDEDAGGTERVPETESPGAVGERSIDLNKHNTFAGETMPLEDTEQVQVRCEDSQQHSQSNNQERVLKAIEDTQPGDTIRTVDLLASEVAGSWACSTAPSVHGENETPGSREIDEEAHVALHDCSALVAESQSAPPGAPTARLQQDNDRWALSNMVGIMAPDLREQFGSAVGDGSQDGETKVPNSDSDTESYADDNNNAVVGADGESTSDSETQGNDDPIDEDKDNEEAMEEDDEATQEDSVG
ncbi:hypothetical protein Ancab_037132 [Ancistrocladus abbreviatus]